MLTRRRSTSAKSLQAAQTNPPHTGKNPSWSWSVGASYWRILARKTLIGPRGFSQSPHRIGEAAARKLASTTTGTSSRIEGNSPRGHRASLCGSGPQRHSPRSRARGTSTPASPEPQGSSAVPHLARELFPGDAQARQQTGPRSPRRGDEHILPHKRHDGGLSGRLRYDPPIPEPGSHAVRYVARRDERPLGGSSLDLRSPLRRDERERLAITEIRELSRNREKERREYGENSGPSYQTIADFQEGH